MKQKRKRRPLTPEEQSYAKALIEKYDPVIRRVVSARLEQRFYDEFEDVVQNVYETICTQLDDFMTYDKPEALVVTITTRAVWRVHKRWKETVSITDEEALAAPTEPDIGLVEILPDGMPSGDRELLTAVYQNRKTEKEVAEATGEKPSTVRQRVKRARDRLKKVLEKT